MNKHTWVQKCNTLVNICQRCRLVVPDVETVLMPADKGKMLKDAIESMCPAEDRNPFKIQPEGTA